MLNSNIMRARQRAPYPSSMVSIRTTFCLLIALMDNIVDALIDQGSKPKRLAHGRDIAKIGILISCRCHRWGIVFINMCVSELLM